MWLGLNFMDGSRERLQISYTSRLELIETFRKRVSNLINVPSNRLRLYFRGKEIVDVYENKDRIKKKATLLDYRLNITNTVQLMVKEEIMDDKKNMNPHMSVINDKEIEIPSPPLKRAISKFFKGGELVDAKYVENEGAWTEAKIVGIFEDEKYADSPNCNTDNEHTPVSNGSQDNVSIADSLIYTVEFEDHVRLNVTLKDIRPRARRKILFKDVQIGSQLMVNYNTVESEKVGYWYDFLVMDIKISRTKKRLIGTIYLGLEETPSHLCEIKFIDHLYEIEKTVTIAARDYSQSKLMLLGPTEKRLRIPDCDSCNDVPEVKCTVCSCFECGGKDSPDKQIVCDECQNCFHLWCLDTPIEEMPKETHWYCSVCKNDDEIELPGQIFKSERRNRMPSSNKSTSRDWGSGWACAGRTKEPDVEKDIFGHIPGVHVGQMWQYRLQVSESGVHRPPVGGIHGREKIGAFSIVLAGGYDDDEDQGDTFYYTGSGGRDLSGNKRTAPQSFDQTLTKMNKAMAQNCNAIFNDKNGAEAINWQNGKPIRVVRSYKGRKFSTYCPEFGLRYDGLYKVVKYWPEFGKSGFVVWRFLLKRDDMLPAPWTSDGQMRIEELGLQFQFEYDSKQKSENNSKLTNKRKRKSTKEIRDEESQPLLKKAVKFPYDLPKNVSKLISYDEINSKIWDNSTSALSRGEKPFQDKVKEHFKCPCCFNLVIYPVTTVCGHNFCQSCLQKCLADDNYVCPSCRTVLGDHNNYKLVVNENLQEILRSLFLWYDV